MRRRRRVGGAVVGTLLVLCCVIVACENGTDEAAPAEAAPTAGPDVDAEPEPAAYAPLTGVPLDDEALLERPVVAVKIDNAPQARPQRGLGEADVVFVHPVEGGITRMVALFHAALPEQVGPVRSGRDVDADILPSFQPVFAYSGAAPRVYPRLAATSMALREEGIPRDAWTRDPARRAPHNLFVTPDALLAEVPDGSPASRPWDIADPDDETANGQPVTDARLRYSAVEEVGWTWMEAGPEVGGAAGEGRWLRRHGDEPHRTDGGDDVQAANVVIARVDAFEGAEADRAGNRGVALVAEGTGDATVLLNGRAVAARWEREDGGHFTWSTADGSPLPLRPGPTWVELVPASGRVEISSGALG